MPRGQKNAVSASAALEAKAHARAALEAEAHARVQEQARALPVNFAEVLGGRAGAGRGRGGSNGSGSSRVGASGRGSGGAGRGGRQAGHPAVTAAAEDGDSGVEEDDDDDDKDGEASTRTAARPGRRSINIQFIHDKTKRHITFSKRKNGVIKKVSPAAHTYSLVLCYRGRFAAN